MKSWDEVEAQAKVKEQLAQEIEALAAELNRKFEELHKANLEQFTAAPQTDALFYDCPNAPGRMNYDFRAHLMKNGCPWEKRPLESVGIPDFAETIKSGNKWILKLKPQEVINARDDDHHDRNSNDNRSGQAPRLAKRNQRRHEGLHSK